MKRNLENELWGKALLSIFRYLEKIANSIDNLVKKIGINSSFNYHIYNSAQSCSAKIIELTERKIKIINLKVIIEEALTKLADKDVKILNLSYVDGLNDKAIQNVLNITERTFFRRKEFAIARFSSALSSLGYNAKKLWEYLKTENWILNTYKNNLNTTASFYNNNLKNANQYKLLKLVLNDFNSNCTQNYSSF